MFFKLFNVEIVINIKFVKVYFENICCLVYKILFFWFNLLKNMMESGGIYVCYRLNFLL